MNSSVDLSPVWCDQPRLARPTYPERSNLASRIDGMTRRIYSNSVIGWDLTRYNNSTLM